MTDSALWFATGDEAPFRADGITVRDSSSEAGDDRDEQPGRCVVGDGAIQYSTVGDTSTNVLSYLCWVKAQDITAHTDGVMKLSATDGLRIVNGTVTLFGQTGTIYVDNAAGSTIADITDWHMIYVELDAVVDADALVWLYDGTNFSTTYLFHGVIYDRVLTSDEQTAKYRQGTTHCDRVVPGQPIDPAGQWHFDDASTTTNRDSSGNGLDGTITAGDAGMLVTSATVPYSPQNLYGFTET